MKNLSPTNKPIKIIPSGLYSLARVHKPGSCTAPECKPTCFSGAFLFEPYTRKPWGSAPRDQEDIGRDEPVRGCRKAGEIQRPSPFNLKNSLVQSRKPNQPRGRTPWVKLIQTGRGGSRQCVDKVALNFKSKAAQINFCAAFFLWRWI